MVCLRKLMSSLCFVMLRSP
ncbi:hypothetical protein LINPERPRIM_LOCUS22871 [Linum perenne]